MYTPTKEIISKNLQKFLFANHMTQTELAEAIGVTTSSVSLWVLGKTAPRADMVDRICRVFKITKDEFLRNYDDPSTSALSKSIPLYNSIHAKLDSKDSTVERYIAVDQSINADFGVRVVSHSMADVGIEYGDIALFSKDYTFGEGNIYAVWVTFMESVAFKRVYTKGKLLVLISEHNDFAPLILENEEAYIIGELTGVFKPINQIGQVKSQHAAEWEHLYNSNEKI